MFNKTQTMQCLQGQVKREDDSEVSLTSFCLSQKGFIKGYQHQYTGLAKKFVIYDVIEKSIIW